MKKTAVVLLSAIMWLGISSCQKTKDKVDQLTEFDMSYSTPFTVPASSVAVNTPADFTTPDIPTNASSQFSAQKTATDKITEIKLTKFTMQASSGNFDYLKSITVFMQASGQPEIQIATKTDIPTGLSSLDMDASGANIKNYLIGTTFKFRINVVIDGAITTSQEMKLNQTMHVKAVLL